MIKRNRRILIHTGDRKDYNPDTSTEANRPNKKQLLQIFYANPDNLSAPPTPLIKQQVDQADYRNPFLLTLDFRSSRPFKPIKHSEIFCWTD